MGAVMSRTPVMVPVSPSQLAAADFHDASIDADGVLERIHLTFGEHDLVIEDADLLKVIDAARRVLDDAEIAVLDARQDRAEQERRECWCGTLIERDELTCGAARCERFELQDRQDLIP